MSSNGSEPVGPETPRARAPRQQAATSQDPDVLAAEIERTREDLAQTLDAIADRVSPKRVAGRTRTRVAEIVGDVTEQLRGRVAPPTLASAPGGAATTAGSGLAGLPPVTAVPAAGLDLSTPVATAPGPAASTAPAASGPTPTTFPTAPATPPPGTGATGGLRPEHVAGGVLGVVVLLLLRRRRRSRAAVAAPGLLGAAAGRKAARRKRGRKARGRGARATGRRRT